MADDRPHLVPDRAFLGHPRGPRRAGGDLGVPLVSGRLFRGILAPIVVEATHGDGLSARAERAAGLTLA